MKPNSSHQYGSSNHLIHQIVTTQLIHLLKHRNEQHLETLEFQALSKEMQMVIQPANKIDKTNIMDQQRETGK